ncbi:3-ketoacyl-ACP reductase [uncultured Roseobacter sp.]|uniref:3-ketoacyl-ACP reductase n=1 Tax=uncultured Roseobacter sp. TaxID=114847 RepID=UPI00261F0ABD|nr:3-ketoacyl-ACP reductase [uncultured Roseobacter sp.]
MSRTALVTGGQQGIGFAAAKELIGAGFQVAVVSLPPDDDPKVLSALSALGPKAHYFQHDIADVDRIPALLDRVEKALGPLTTLVSNAGVGAPVRGDMLDLVPENWDHVLGVNLRGAFFLAQAVAKRMVKSPSEHYRSIAFITSVSAKMASTTRAEYCISKAGAGMMSDLFALRLAPHGIGVFELRPGIIATDMTAAVRDEYTPRIENGLVPAERWGEPQDIAEIVLAIANGQMRFANGACIPVDGGLSIPRL